MKMKKCNVRQSIAVTLSVIVFFTTMVYAFAGIFWIGQDRVEAFIGACPKILLPMVVLGWGILLYFSLFCLPALLAYLTGILIAPSLKHMR